MTACLLNCKNRDAKGGGGPNMRAGNTSKAQFDTSGPEADAVDRRGPSAGDDRAQVGQSDLLKLKAFNGRQNPIIFGCVAQISADATLAVRARKTHCQVKVALLPVEMAKPGDKDLIPGRPVKAFLSTETRAPPDHVLRPCMFHSDRVFRDWRGRSGGAPGGVCAAIGC